MTARRAFEYAVLRAVPRVDRGESMNIGVLLYCGPDAFLSARARVDGDRLRVLDPGVDVAAVRAAVDAIIAACEGDRSAGPVADDPPGQRFRWLSATRSTVVQPGPIHSGVTDDPSRELDRLFAALVA